MSEASISPAKYLKQLRDRELKIVTSYSINDSFLKKLEANIQKEFGTSDDHIALSTTVAEYDSIASAFQTVVHFIDQLSVDSGVVSGAVVYARLLKLKAIQPGFSIEENREHFKKIFNNLKGSKEAIEALKTKGLEIFELAVPYLETLQAKKIKEQELKLKVINEAIEANWFKPVVMNKLKKGTGDGGGRKRK